MMGNKHFLDILNNQPNKIQELKLNPKLVAIKLLSLLIFVFSIVDLNS